MNKKTWIILCVILLVGLTALIASLNQDKSIKTFTLQASKTSDKNKNVTKTEPSPTESPKYSVTITDKSTYVIGSCFNIAGKINNISAKPFITDVGFDKCVLVDQNGVKYSGFLMNAGYKFTKALLAGESSDFYLKTVCGSMDHAGNNIRLDYGGNGSIPRECKYDANGNTVCQNIEGISILSCNANITTDGSQVSNGWGKYPIEIQFPK